MFRVIIILVYDIFLAHPMVVDDIRQALAKNLQVLVLVHVARHYSQWSRTMGHYIVLDHDGPSTILHCLLYVLLLWLCPFLDPGHPTIARSKAADPGLV
jgi:hypothetical protein